MSATAPALVAAAAGVGFGHAVLPDHWVPLAVLGRARRYPLAKVARLSVLAAIAHVILSIVLGGVIIAVGLQFRATLQSAQDTIIGCLLVATGIGFAVFELAGRGGAHEHEHERELARDHETRGIRGLAAVMVPFGAAASPDLTILPVFLAASTIGAGAAIGSLAAFGAVTVATIVGLTLAAARGGYEIRGQWLDRWGNTLTALTLILVGALVLIGAL